MSKEYREKLFNVMNQIEDLAEPMRAAAGQPEQPVKNPVQPQAAFDNAQGRELEGQNLNAPKKADTADNKNLPEGWVGANHDTRKRYTKAFKKMIVRLHKDEGRTFDELTNEYGVSQSAIVQWCRDARYKSEKKLDEKEKELQAVKEENERIKSENAFMKQILFMMVGKDMEGLTQAR